jgi:hypothetical protein
MAACKAELPSGAMQPVKAVVKNGRLVKLRIGKRAQQQADLAIEELMLRRAVLLERGVLRVRVAMT